MSLVASQPTIAKHAPHNAMDDAGEIERFYDRCSDLMRALSTSSAETARATSASSSPSLSAFADDVTWSRDTAFAKITARVDGTRMASEKLGI